jgi:hypothetical protein
MPMIFAIILMSNYYLRNPSCPPACEANGVAFCQHYLNSVDPFNGDGVQKSPATQLTQNYFATSMAGGCHFPSPAGRIDGGSVFGQYNRITM